MHFKKILLIFVLILFLLSVSWLCWQAGISHEVSGGTILVGGRSSIQALAISNDFFLTQKNANLTCYFSDNRYVNFHSPTKHGDGLLCSAYNINNKYYAVLQVEGNEIKELITSNHYLSHPILINDNEDLVYTSSDIHNNTYLYKYNLKQQTSIKIYNKSLGAGRPLVSRDGSIIVADTAHRWRGDIIRINSAGEAVQVASYGESPVWIEEGKMLLYYDYINKVVVLYDLITGKKKNVVKTQFYISDLTLSPDKKYIAYVEHVPFGTEFTLGRYLRIFSLDDSFKRSLGTKKLYIGPGMMWMDGGDNL